jgi:hypothetical protein
MSYLVASNDVADTLVKVYKVRKEDDTYLWVDGAFFTRSKLPFGDEEREHYLETNHKFNLTNITKYEKLSDVPNDFIKSLLDVGTFFKLKKAEKNEMVR